MMVVLKLEKHKAKNNLLVVPPWILFDIFDVYQLQWYLPFGPAAVSFDVLCYPLWLEYHIVDFGMRKIHENPTWRFPKSWGYHPVIRP